MPYAIAPVRVGRKFCDHVGMESGCAGAAAGAAARVHVSLCGTEERGKRSGAATELLRIFRREAERDVRREVIDGAQLRLAGIGESNLIVSVEVHGVVDLGEKRRDTDAVRSEQRPALPAQQFPMSAREVCEKNAQAQAVGIRAYVSVGGQVSIEISLRITKYFGVAELFIGTERNARALRGET